jgi:hypothetical protein
MPATLQFTYYGNSAGEPAGTNCDAGSGGTTIEWNLADSLTATTPILIPNPGPGENFSWYKLLALKVTSTAATSISNRKVSVAVTQPTGILQFFKDQATYTQASGVNKPTDSGSDGAVPAGYTTITTTPQLFDNTSVSAGSTGRNGDFCQVVLGVSSTYTGGTASAAALQNMVFTYDEI